VPWFRPAGLLPAAACWFDLDLDLDLGACAACMGVGFAELFLTSRPRVPLGGGGRSGTAEQRPAGALAQAGSTGTGVSVLTAASRPVMNR
jgi:hypothetical protein